MLQTLASAEPLSLLDYRPTSVYTQAFCQSSSSSLLSFSWSDAHSILHRSIKNGDEASYSSSPDWDYYLKLFFLADNIKFLSDDEFIQFFKLSSLLQEFHFFHHACRSGLAADQPYSLRSFCVFYACVVSDLPFPAEVNISQILSCLPEAFHASALNLLSLWSLKTHKSSTEVYRLNQLALTHALNCGSSELASLVLLNRARLHGFLSQHSAALAYLDQSYQLRLKLQKESGFLPPGLNLLYALYFSKWSGLPLRQNWLSQISNQSNQPTSLSWRLRSFLGLPRCRLILVPRSLHSQHIDYKALASVLSLT